MTNRYVDYPVAKSLKEAEDWLQSGGELWQEISDEYPECMGIEDFEILWELSDGTIDEGGEISEEDAIHMVPSRVDQKQHDFQL